MGTSNWQNLGYCIELIREVNPRSILDIGFGFGKWGFLCREFLEVFEGRVKRDDWKIIIDGIEVFNDNIDAYHHLFYSRIYHGDAFYLINSLDQQYDLTILGDVLEHFEKEQSKDFMHRLLLQSKTILLIIPLGTHWQQGELYGNPYEKHRSVWEYEEIRSNFPVLRCCLFRDYIDREFGVFLLSRHTLFLYVLNQAHNLAREKSFISGMQHSLDILREELSRTKIQEKVDLLQQIRHTIQSEKSSLVEIRNTGKGTQSQGEEIWIIRMESDILPFVPLEEPSAASGSWMKKKSEEAWNDVAMVSARKMDSISYPIIGNTVEITLYSHPWSSQGEVWIDGVFRTSFNLFSESPIMVTLTIPIDQP